MPSIVQFIPDLPHLLGDQGVRLRVATAGREDEGPDDGDSAKWKGAHGQLNEVERMSASMPDKMPLR